MSSENTARALAPEVGMVPGTTGAEASPDEPGCDQLLAEVAARLAAAGSAPVA
jgi:hypothetical protein